MPRKREVSDETILQIMIRLSRDGFGPINAYQVQCWLDVPRHESTIQKDMKRLIRQNKVKKVGYRKGYILNKAAIDNNAMVH